jgi:hypothetical protein
MNAVVVAANWGTIGTWVGAAAAVVGVVVAILALRRGRRSGGARAGNQDSPDSRDELRGASGPISGPEATEFETDGLALPEYPSVLYPSSEAEMAQLGPSSWLTPHGSERPELILRVAVALPNVSAAFYGRSEPATSLRGEDREDFLTASLERSPLTAWIREQLYAWNCDGDVAWSFNWIGNPDLTELELRPVAFGARPVSAHLGLLTGWRAEPAGAVPAVRLACDLMFNVSGLTADRRPEPEPPNEPPPPQAGLLPVPAAIPLDDLARYLVALLEVPRLAAAVGARLLPD